MYPKKFITIILLVFIAVLSYQSYLFFLLWSKVDNAKIGAGCNNSNPVVNLTDWNNQVPDMVWGC
jgi:hypothetical protein